MAEPRYGPSPLSLMCLLLLKDLSFILFVITAAVVVPCGGPIKSPRTIFIVQITYSFLSFEVSEDILRNQEIDIGLDSFSNQRSICFGPIWIIIVFVSTVLLNVAKLQ